MRNGKRERDMDPIWRESDRRFRRTGQRLVAEALLYPAAVLLAAGIGAIAMTRTYEGLIDRSAVTRDLWWAGTVTIVLAGSMCNRYRRVTHHRQWYRALARVCAHLDRRTGIVGALERAAAATPGPAGRDLRAAAYDCSGGTPPGQALRIRRCPERLTTRIESSKSETDLVRRLRREFERDAESTNRRLRVLERLAPAATTVGAGLVVLWIVVRFVLPVITALMTGGIYE